MECHANFETKFSVQKMIACKNQIKTTKNPLM